MGATVDRPHMTLLYDSKGFCDSDLGIVKVLVHDWIHETGCSNLTFTLVPWGRRSKLVEGELKELGEYVKAAMASSGFSNDRPFHVQLYK
jgi:hypothetical protein